MGARFARRDAGRCRRRPRRRRDLRRARLARPVAGDELNGLLPARFFALQDELKARSRRLVAASTSRDHAAMADEFGALAKSCVSCHEVYPTRRHADSGGPTMMLDDHYGRLLARTPTMAAAEQQDRSRNATSAAGDRRDAERLVLGNLRLVVKLARELGGGLPGRSHGSRPGRQRGPHPRRGALRSDARREAVVVRGAVDPRLHHALPDGHEPDGSPHVDARGPAAVLRSDAARHRRVVGRAGAPRARRRLGSRGEPAGEPPRRGRQPAGCPVRNDASTWRACARRSTPSRRRSTSAAARS